MLQISAPKRSLLLVVFSAHFLYRYVYVPNHKLIGSSQLRCWRDFGDLGALDQATNQSDRPR